MNIFTLMHHCHVDLPLEFQSLRINTTFRLNLKLYKWSQLYKQSKVMKHFPHSHNDMQVFFFMTFHISCLFFTTELTSTGFLRKMKKFSARIIMNLINLWHRIFSISSAQKNHKYLQKIVWQWQARHLSLKVHHLTCLTAMLTLTELMEPSIRTFSLSFRLMTTGCNRSSLLLLY